MGKKQFGIEPSMLQHYADQIRDLINMGVEVAIVIGGGNIFRGLQAEGSGIEIARVDALGVDLEPGPGYYPALLQQIADRLSGCLSD